MIKTYKTEIIEQITAEFIQEACKRMCFEFGNLLNLIEK
jgi:hypothetical protein